MKALLYKDFLVLFKQMKFFLIMVAIFCLMPNELNMGSFFVVYSGLFIPISLLAYDERAKWDAMAAMMPYHTRDLVASRYIIGWCCTGFAAVFWLLGRRLFPREFFESVLDLYELVILISAVLLIMSLAFPLFFRFGTERARLYVIVGCVAIGAVIGGSSLLLKEPALFALHLNLLVLTPLLLVVSLVLSLVSIKVSMKQYEKRAW